MCRLLSLVHDAVNACVHTSCSQSATYLAVPQETASLSHEVGALHPTEMADNSDQPDAGSKQGDLSCIAVLHVSFSTSMVYSYAVA